MEYEYDTSRYAEWKMKGSQIISWVLQDKANNLSIADALEVAYIRGFNDAKRKDVK